MIYSAKIEELSRVGVKPLNALEKANNPLTVFKRKLFKIHKSGICFDCVRGSWQDKEIDDLSAVAV